MIPRLVLTTGESAGIGPDVILQFAQQHNSADIVVVGCKRTLSERAETLKSNIHMIPFNSADPVASHEGGTLKLIDIPLIKPCLPGEPDVKNATQILAQLELALSLCKSGDCQAMVTAPIHKSVINAAGFNFSGHTEFLAGRLGVSNPIMLLAASNLKIALLTTHIPLRSVADAITPLLLRETITTLVAGLNSLFCIPKPRITVLGLNPHAGEDGYLGEEELLTIGPVCDELRAEGIALKGPISADTAFGPEIRAKTDAYLAMFHDQGLPVIKSESFGDVVNVTLGLPIIRTSVDHGTALSLAGTGRANSSSLAAAVALASEMTLSRHQTT